MFVHRRSRLQVVLAMLMVALVLAVPANVGAYSTVITSWRINSTVNGHLKGPFQYNAGTGTYTLRDHTATQLNVSTYYETAFISNSARSIYFQQYFPPQFNLSNAVVVNSSGTVIATPGVNSSGSGSVDWIGAIGANSTLFLRTYGTISGSLPFSNQTSVKDVNNQYQLLLNWTIQTS
jgi:hypothetical protein